MSEDFEPIEKVEPPCQIYYLQSSSGKVYRCYLKSEADKVIAEKDKVISEKDEEIRRLHRALYKVCANWAHFAVAFFSSYVTKNRWRWMELKCLKKAEEYK